MESSPGRAGWDWAFMYYCAKKLLNMSEKEFWECTPRKFLALLRVHKEFISSETDVTKTIEEQEVYIDEIPFL